MLILSPPRIRSTIAQARAQSTLNAGKARRRTHKNRTFPTVQRGIAVFGPRQPTVLPPNHARIDPDFGVYPAYVLSTISAESRDVKSVPASPGTVSAQFEVGRRGTPSLGRSEIQKKLRCGMVFRAHGRLE